MQNWEGEYLYSKSEMFQTRDVLKDYGIHAHSIHASEGGKRTVHTPDGKLRYRNRYRLTDIRKDYTSTNEYLRLAGVDLLKNRIDLCTYIKCICYGTPYAAPVYDVRRTAGREEEILRAGI